MNIRGLGLGLSGLLMLISAPVVNAQSPYSISLGADMWWGSTKVNEVRKDDDQVPSFSVALEHELPYLPNVSFRYTTIDADYMAFDKYDYTFYYTIFDHELMDFDFGVAFSQYSNSKYIAPIGSGANGAPQSFDELTWNWFGKALINVPNTHFDVIGQVDFGDSKGLKTTDFIAGMQYRLPVSSGELALKGGYRVIDIESDDFTVDVENHKEFIFANGWFLGAEFQY
ncbi:TIGR04219 family outer membrane beta-barrel protein [Vibrio genomosp. F10]|uniref:Iron-hydroxamate ABC transporter substrate-binding protein n=1 Tax=Vibrio genomosp. F10 TaxID=723171 RepID=A0A1B9QWA6_9VIBR|nr:TIGR04219 family outer membrane beta-barrel protein [Vibrio genomosp. F10]OCH73781.1 iron-hydroxamate ABC transporter substrate-binding protein [Vibrio genomosp. F10]OEE93463.1 iron-hydroxamate ABC transporter substrate-binding protein [Vibrio genomosp. F10 str. 9ZC157]OEF00966.1 iron-hydroxamate ABC transporter substrate-binding protein [Vibrio genomosp. F10 str. 9ZD137]OEF05780.1 iron-hydroxamate ABC transporter substrate-binding protein [Vibrio genomosp. F10 str. 9ZB36]